MDLKLLTWNNMPINDGVSYAAYILPESKFNINSQPNYQDRAEGYPFLSGAMLPAVPFLFRVTIVPDDPCTQDDLRQQLSGYFNPLDFQPHALIAEDRNDKTAGVAKKYQLIGLPVRGIPTSDEGSGLDRTFLITIATTEPVWSAVTQSSNTWAITASAQTKTITPGGNTFVRPKFTITPTTARTGQFQYSRWCQIYNRKTDTPLNNYPIDVTNGGISTSALVNFTAVSNQINVGGGINASVTTIPIDTSVGGGLPATGMGYVGTEQISWTGNTGTNLTGVTRGVGGTTAATHADNAVIALSKMMANGADVAVQVDGQLVNFWIDSPNTASSKIWIGQNWQAGQAGVLLTALPNNGTAVTVAFTRNTTNKNALIALKTAKNSVFIIDSEAFTFSPGNVDLVNYQITSCSRAQKNTSFAAHSVAAAITWIEHDIWLLYGNPAGSPFTVDNTYKPLLNLNTATNTSWTFSNFFDNTSSNRPGAWLGTVIASVGQSSLVYTGNQTALADPSTELGSSLINYVQANVWKAETASIAWSFYHPCGITTVSMSGSKRLISGTSWPTIAGLQKSANGSTWQTVWTEAIPALNTWVAWTHNGQALGATYKNIRLALIGTIAALASNEADIQGDTITLTLDSTVTPSVTLNAENNIYYLNAKITNMSSPNLDFILLSFQMALNRTLTVDTLKKTVTYDDGSNAIAALTLSNTRNDWLPLAAGDNILKYEDTGIANVTVVETHNDRNF